LRTFPHHLCLIQVGCYFEAYGWQAEVLQQTAGLKRKAKWRGFAPACGFPKEQLPAVLSKLQQQRLPLVVVEETGYELPHAKERLITAMIEYPEHELGQNTTV
jgi:MutS domain I